ncbi:MULTISPECIES: DUF4062 domain-containing protein [Carnobacterium]|uniref:DUF4062 domain-containing protein n=1 Tax=Carnobacterium TaxID=2747 RepID=UPI0028916625|nr:MULTISPECIES: DUF4062 domain-containing protein [Carnobacterium]MDT1940481.1 DUF4062 domain-containing protein [Carnobacterium divergens]MDT1942919.1 DUF4062 domain-containing protein [Carnobacterium divergens]MDT1948725.1 DUF4062 domain-containing protein [Carnobacterium divergens]MDT1951206.1 DUF4062 domain-containing protein [Carnobacterium divergens]MDT1956264.1 DUF4062 domain-containing protein [Carnobacterium divergens]
MSFNATVLKVLIASPSDVLNERDEIERAIFEWNLQYADTLNKILLPIRWESAVTPSYSEKNDPQEIINEQIVKDCDYVIGVFWTKLGTPTKHSKSGTIEEISKFIENKQSNEIMVYFKKEAFPQESDLEEIQKLKEYKQAFSGIYSDYNKESIIKHLYSKVRSLEDGSKATLTEEIAEEINGNSIEALLKKEILSPEDILMLKFIKDSGQKKFGVRWKQEKSVDEITAWEEKNKVKPIVSTHYEKVIGNFSDRKFMLEDEYTSYGNVRQYQIPLKVFEEIEQLGNCGQINEMFEKHLKC